VKIKEKGKKTVKATVIMNQTERKIEKEKETKTVREQTTGSVKQEAETLKRKN
jgi:hypothetical protein